MSDLNRVSLLGRLTKDPSAHTFPDGEVIANAGLATTETWKDKTTGERREATEFHQLVFTRGKAKVALEYLVKGSSVYIEGKLTTRKWQDSDGKDRYSTEIRVTELKMTGGKRKEGAPAELPAPEQEEEFA